jgi:hypothetical protein
MNIAVGVVVILVGNVCLTPRGAAWMARYNQANADPAEGSQAPRTVRGAQFGGVFAIVVGVLFIVS